MNQASPFLHRDQLEITLTVPLTIEKGNDVHNQPSYTKIDRVVDCVHRYMFLEGG